MSLRDVDSPFHGSTRPIATEFARLTAILAGVYLWQRLVRAGLSAVAGPGTGSLFDGVVLDGLVYGGAGVGGVLLFTAAYADARNTSLGLQLPARRDLPLVGLAGLVPLVGVGLTKLVGTVTGVQYNGLLQYSVAADPPLLPVPKLTGLSLLVGVPLFVVVCQLLIQESLSQILDVDRAIALTTVVAGFVLLSSTGDLNAVPDRGKLLAALMVVLLVGFGPYLLAQFGPDRRPAVAYAPAVLFVGFVVVSGIAALDTIAGGLFTATHLAVLSVAAYSYDRTGSVVAPAVAYAVLELANTGVVFFFEAGMQNW